jgi:hypothetical protein
MSRNLAHYRNNQAQNWWQAGLVDLYSKVGRKLAAWVIKNFARRYNVSSQAVPINLRSTKTVFPVLWAASFSHLLNDMLQALLPAVYPILRGGLTLALRKLGF